VYARTRVRGRRRELRIGFIAALLLVAVAVWPAAGGGAKVPNIPNIPGVPKVPKFTSYPVTIDAAGFVDFEWTWDDRQACIPSYAKTVSEELSFEFGRPVRTSVHVVGGAVSMPFAIGGEAKLKAKASGFQENNYCPPTAPEPAEEAPDCRTLTGKLGATLSPEADDASGGGLVPLGQGVMINFIRKGGGMEPTSCTKNRPRLDAVQKKKGVNVETTASLGPLTVPLTTDAKFWSLKPGGRISRTIRIGGGCEGVTATASRLSPYVTRCTISGRVVVVIKRLK
jgi:hypothetical protein